MQVYRDMDIGTAKPSRAEQESIRHHMLDLREPEDEFSVAEFQRMARDVLEERPNQRFLIVGGSGLHYRAVLDQLVFPPTDLQTRRELESLPPEVIRDRLLAADPAAVMKIDMRNPRRVLRAYEVYLLTGETPTDRDNDLGGFQTLYPTTTVGLDPGPELASRASQRLEAMRSAGFLDEVVRLQHRLGRTAAQAVGYKQLLEVCRGVIDIEQGFAAALRATVATAKRQRTYFRRDPRIRWVAWHDDPQQRIERVMSALEESP